VADTAFPIRFLRGELEADNYDVPTQAKQLHALVVLLLNAGRPVSLLTLRNGMWDESDQEWGASNSAIQTPISRLRQSGWPIPKRGYKLNVDPGQVDILAFDERAKTFLSDAKRALATAAVTNELLARGRDLDAAWEKDPAQFLGDAPVASLFDPYLARRKELLDVLANLESMPNQQTVEVPPTSTESNQRAIYLRDVLRRGSTLAFGNPSSWGSDDANDGLVRMEDLWTPLRVADSQQRAGTSGTHESMTERDTGSDLLTLVESANDPVVVLGEPGSGKSTSAAMLAARSARRAINGAAQIPIWVNLGAIVANPRWTAEKILLSGVPELELAISRSGEHAGLDLSQFLENALVTGNALLLLDGLDEVKDFALPKVRDSINIALSQRNGSKVVISCRTFDYRHDSPSRKVPVEQELELLPLSQQEKIDYVARWYAAAARAGGFRPDLADSLRDALQQEILRKSVVADMAGLPLLLALLTLIHSRQELPDSRSVVCDQAIKFMLAETPPWRERDPGAPTEASGPIVRLAVEVAFRRHLAEEDKSNSGGWLTHELILSEAKKIVESLRQAGAARGTPSPEALSEQFENSHGLLLEAGPDRFRFSHRYFQEYLAGQHFARGRDRALALSSGGGTHWREPFRLMASFAGHNGDNLYYILQLITDLLDAEDVSAQQLAAEMLVEITPPRLALWDFAHVLEEAEASGQEGLWARARARLLSHVESDALALAERERSGQALASLGDRRVVGPGGITHDPWAHTADVAGGARNVGTTRLSPDQVLGAFVSPPRELTIQGFKIGKYPVTNVEFGTFIEDNGYSDLAHWRSRRSRGWVQGDPEILKELIDGWLETVNDHHAKELRDGEISRENLLQEASRRTAARTHPYYWHDARFNRANQPVVGINYWEAEAYCAWATARGHRSGALPENLVIALPTEFEWECASRPLDDDRIYPWGDEWDDERALVTTNTLNLRAPTAVGVYPEPWPGGPRDLAGNVWEWTSSVFRPYDASEDERRTDPDSLDERVVRGGSWYNFGPLTACSVRAVDRAYNLFYDVGFRIAVVEANSRGHDQPS
jgi:formylglycine-generating enzyme required for sulfatase activity/DNA-binding winged helix-turn-helix (wHTH) protein